MATPREVLDAIDDVLVVRTHHPVLATRMARAGASCQELSEMAWRWFHGDSSIPSWCGAFNPSRDVLARKAKRR